MEIVYDHFLEDLSKCILTYLAGIGPTIIEKWLDPPKTCVCEAEMTIKLT